jgi:hypothetical protein
MSYEFTLVLSREITDEESEALQKVGCAGASLSTAKLPTNADVTVTQLDFDIDGASLAAVIESALEAVLTVPDLTAASLIVPPQPSGLTDDDGKVVEGQVVPAAPATEATAPEVVSAEVAAESNGHAPAAEEGDSAPKKSTPRKTKE